MRVNLSYSVKLEEVLSELQILFKREKTKFDIATRNSMKTLDDHYTDENIREVYASLGNCKKAILDFDIKMGELQQIIKGYYDIVNAPLDTEESTPPEETTFLDNSTQSIANAEVEGDRDD